MTTMRIMFVGILVLLLAGFAIDITGAPQKGAMNVPLLEQDSGVKAMKASDAWMKMEDALDDYDAHYIDATNKIAQVSDATTRSALTKSLRATDDCRDALVKLIRCFKDYIKAQGN